MVRVSARQARLAGPWRTLIPWRPAASNLREGERERPGHPVAPLVLRLIQRFVGRADEIVDLQSVARRTRDTNAHRDRERANRRRHAPPADMRPNALCHLQGVLRGASGQNKEELLATVPPDDVIDPQGSLEQPAHLAQDAVSDEVAVRIVDVFEPVDVREEDGDGAIVTSRVLERTAQDLQDGCAIQEPGQIIAVRLGSQLILHADQSLCGTDTGVQLVHIEGLADVVIGAGLEAGNQVLLAPSPREHDDVGAARIARLAQLAAELGAAHAGHHPVDDRELRRVFPLQ